VHLSILHLFVCWIHCRPQPDGLTNAYLDLRSALALAVGDAGANR
jgi:hypothetical protein